VEPFSPLELVRRGSLYVTRPTLFDFIGERTELEAGTQELFTHLREGTIEISIPQRYALRDVAQAHRDLEGRKTTGSSVLVP
jgi:NADPH2:quinone reductase